MNALKGMGHEIWSIYYTKPVFRNINILQVEATVLAKTVAPKIFSHLAQKISNFFTTSPVPRMSGQAFKVTGPHMAANYGLEIQASSFNQ